IITAARRTSAPPPSSTRSTRSPSATRIWGSSRRPSPPRPSSPDPSLPPPTGRGGRTAKRIPPLKWGRGLPPPATFRGGDTPRPYEILPRASLLPLKPPLSRWAGGGRGRERGGWGSEGLRPRQPVEARPQQLVEGGVRLLAAAVSDGALGQTCLVAEVDQG